jgi:predicted Fe-Mo cluster-binding NifX family protein
MGNRLNQESKESSQMKIAVVTEDETNISQHFGRAPLYIVFTVENGKITGKEKRSKIGHGHQAAGHDDHHAQGGPHGYDAASQNIHAGMAGAITDCQVLIAGGMGMGAYDSLKSYKIEPIVTDVKNIEKAVKLYIAGDLPNLMERLH